MRTTAVVTDCIYISIYLSSYIYIYVYVYIYLYIYLSIYICIYTYISTHINSVYIQINIQMIDILFLYIYIYLDLDIKIDQYNGQIVEPIDIHVLPNFHHPKGVKPQTVKQTWTSLNSNNFVGCKCINVQAISLGSWTTQR